MEVLKIILGVVVFALSLGAVLVKYALRNGIHVPTNKELIWSSKAFIEARKNPKEKKDTTVKAKEIRKLN